jgi:hypothetical protein
VVYGSGVLAVTIDSTNADVQIIDIKPANKTASTTRRDAPCCATSWSPDPPGSRPCDDAALVAAEVRRDGSVTSLDVLIIMHVAM